MTSPPADGPSPVRIDVPTEKVDATLDLVEILNSISAGIENLRAEPRTRTAVSATAEERLTSIGELANRLAAELAAVQGEAPELQQALEADSAERNQ